MKTLPEGTIASLSKDHIVTIYGRDGRVVGEIDFSGEAIIFEGNMDETADKLFSFLKKIIIPFFKKD